MSLQDNKLKIQALLENILALPEAGSGIPANVSVLDAGSFTVSEDTSTVPSIHCGFSETPNFIFLYANDENISPAPKSIIAQFRLAKRVIQSNGAERPNVTLVMFYNSNSVIGGSSTITGTSVDTKTIFNPGEAYLYSSTSVTYRAGYTYHWICGVLDGIV